MRRFRPFQVRLPSGDRYWTVVDAAYRPVTEADDWLLHVRLGRDGAQSTTEAYARSLALFLEWCAAIGQDWRETPGQFGRFVYWVEHYDPEAPGYAQLRVVRGASRVNAVLAAVRQFFRHSVAVGLVDRIVLDALFDQVEDCGLPAEIRGDRAGLRLRCRPRHKLSEPERVVDAASDEEVPALLRACRNARDRFIVLALWRIGNRRGELTGVRMKDVHFVPDATRLGCRVRGEHLHVRRRDNPNGATAKSRRSRAVPADWFVAQGYDQYMLERGDCPPAGRCDFLLVNLFREPLGAPMRPRALNELLAGLSRRAGLRRCGRSWRRSGRLRQAAWPTWTSLSSDGPAGTRSCSRSTCPRRCGGPLPPRTKSEARTYGIWQCWGCAGGSASRRSVRLGCERPPNCGPKKNCLVTAGRQAASTCKTTIGIVGELSACLRLTRPDQGQDPTVLSRRDIVAFTNRPARGLGQGGAQPPEANWNRQSIAPWQVEVRSSPEAGARRYPWVTRAACAGGTEVRFAMQGSVSCGSLDAGMRWVLGVAAEHHDRCDGEEGGGEHDEDAGLDALECPVPAGGLVGDVSPVPVGADAGNQVARPLAEERAAG